MSGTRFFAGTQLNDLMDFIFTTVLCLCVYWIYCGLLYRVKTQSIEPVREQNLGFAHSYFFYFDQINSGGRIIIF